MAWGIRWWLVVDFDKVEVEVERQFETVGQFHFIVAFVAVYFHNRGFGPVLFYIGGNLGRNDGGGNGAVLAIDFFPVAVFVEFDFCAAGEDHFIGAFEEFPFVFGVGHFFIGEVLLDEGLCILRQLVDGNHAVVVGFGGDCTQREQDGGKNH